MIDIKSILPLTIASIKMYFRDTTAIFFTFVFPILFLVVFGFIGSGNSINLDIAYYNDKSTPASEAFDEAFQELVKTDETKDDSSRIFSIDDTVEDVEAAREKLADSELNAVIIVPDSFSYQEGGEVSVLVDESNQAFGDVTESVVDSILQGFNTQANIEEFGRPPIAPFSSTSEGVQSDDLDNIDYLVPGIIAFSILSLGVFSITEGFIQLKTDGSLRRLQVAPIEAGSFLVAQSLTRLIMTIINVLTMMFIAVLMFDFNLRGDIFSFLLVATAGIILFLGFGYAIAGWAKDGNQAAPVSNIIFFPMMFLSGTFFPRESFPEWLVPVTDYMPLTYVADAMRNIANNGATILDVGPELLGIAVWTVAVYGIAVKIFKWE